MTDGPKIELLPYGHRKRFFWLLVIIFLVTLPSLIFYTTGYRLSFEDKETTIFSTGGVYITTDNLEVEVYLDEEKINQPRLFRSAYYIQNIEAGLHRVVVQRPDLQTWVKVLPVDPYLVVEASAFNMPTITHLRPVTEYVTATGTPVYLGVSSASEFLSGATTTIPVIFSTTTATTTLQLNEEYIFVESLFSTSSVTRQSIFQRILNGTDRFRFATTSATQTATSSGEVEEFIQSGNTRIIYHDEDLYAVWQGPLNTTPHYFCVADDPIQVIARRYGEHVADEIERLNTSTTTPIIVDGNRLCRPEIKLDRQRKDVYFYDFFPDNSDLVLLQLSDGLYVTEIDDRSWQNSQLLYRGEDFQVVVENGLIFVYDNGYYFEIITKIESE